MEDQERVIPAFESRQGCSCDNDDVEWSHGSSCSSYYSDSDSSVPEWESSINENGELFFIDCEPVVSYTGIQVEVENVNFSSNSLRRSTRSKFLKLLRRRDSKRRSKQFQKNHELCDGKVKFQDYEEGEIREVVLKIDQENRKLGRRGTLVESVLGLTVSTLSDGSRIMVAGFIPDSEAAKQKNIKIGDWLKSINNVDVTLQNLNLVLEQINSENVILRLQRVAGVEVTKNPPINELSNQSNFVQCLVNTNFDKANTVSLTLCEHPIGIIYINTDNLSETGPEYEGLIYCYPKPFEKNLLCNTRGVYITLNNLLPGLTRSSPQLSTVLYENHLAHIAYGNFNKNILLLMLPDNHTSTKEVLLTYNEIVRMLEFLYQNVDNCFENKKNELDHYFSRFFARLLSSGLWPNTEQSLESATPSNAQKLGPCLFENLLSVAHSLVLPEEAQTKIDDALTELEASDYREWNEDPLDCQRLFTFLGSAVYHSGYLLASHLDHVDLIDVHIFCRQQGLFHLSRTEPVRTLVLWKQVFPTSCKNKDIGSEFSNLGVPNGNQYLLMVGYGKDLLVAIMETGGCTESPEDNTRPDAFYVEEAQATLAHLQELGISNLAEHWITTNPGIQVALPEIPVKRKSDFLGNITFSKTSITKDIIPVPKKPEVTSILKHRSSDQNLQVDTNSSFSFDEGLEVQSEDSISQGGYSEKSEISDEPVLGRRAYREKKVLGSDEESDIEDYRGSNYSNSSYDLTELRQSLLAETAEMKPQYLTVGDKNILYHFAQLDNGEGLLLCPPENQRNSKTSEEVLNNFRRCAQEIHAVFENTLRFKSMLSQDMAKCVFNKSLIAIKEYGSLFECRIVEDTSKKFDKLVYWVIGRLFYMPHPRELYICYQDSTPQNLIEIAFKLGITG